MGHLFLVRHGESVYNEQNRFTGKADVPLTELGRQQAQIAGEKLKGYPLDKAYTSTLSRAQQTLRIILQTVGKEDLPSIESAALNERDYGDLQGRNKAVVAREVGEDQVMQWRRSYDSAPPDGESLKDTIDRAWPYFTATIRVDVEAGYNVLVVAHGNSLRGIVKDLENINDQDIPHLEITTGEIMQYELNRAGEVMNKHVL